MTPSTFIFLVTSSCLGILTVLSSYHWFLAWMGLELTSLAILPLLASHHHPRAVEAATKYFIVQATGAAVLLFAAIVNACILGHWGLDQPAYQFATSIATVALCLKLGLSPLHLWVPEVLQGLDLLMGLLVTTWQKLAPLLLLFQLDFEDPQLLLTFAVASTLVAGWSALNQTQVRKIMAYSSIAHTGWILAVLPYSTHIALLTFAVYVLTTAAIMYHFHKGKSHTLYSLHQVPMDATTLLLLCLLLMSLAGLPPLPGFGVKLLILSKLTTHALRFVSTVLVMSAILNLGFYLRLSYLLGMVCPTIHMSCTPRWRLTPRYRSFFMTLTLALALSLLPLLPFLATAFTG